MVWKKQHVFRRYYYLPAAVVVVVVAVLVRTTVAARRRAADKDVVHDVQHLWEGPLQMMMR